MILGTPESVTARVHHESGRVPGKTLLMVRPDYFDIAYAINPHMRADDGSLKVVDKEKAITQWNACRKVYEDLGLKVEVLDGQPKFPDMVFAANQSFVFATGENNGVILSAMASEERKGEIAFFESYFREKGYQIFSMAAYGTVAFEGNGDALLHPNGTFLWGGHGYRTAESAYEIVSRLTRLPVAPLHLIDPSCYHLDTCFSILNAKTVVIQESAFDAPSLARIHAGFETVIGLDPEENTHFFAGNCFCPNSKDVLLQPGATQLVAQLKEHGFTVHEVDTSEFIKAGGSVFCMKMQVF